MLVEQCGCPSEGSRERISSSFERFNDYLGEDVNGCTALFYAITLDHPDACQLLLELKADPDHQDHRGRTYARTGSCSATTSAPI